MEEIKSPFNFLPINTRVFYPNWARLITQDIPFENGISGSLELTIKADTPIFVRNGHTQEDNELKTDRYNSFSKFPDGRYFIPGASVKGAVRSVLEVLSMGKVHVDENAMFAWPRLDKGVKIDSDKILCGWLKRGLDDTYTISVCKGNPRRIAIWEIDKLLNTHILEEHFSSEKKFNLNKECNFEGTTYDPKTAAFKYALLRSLGGGVNLEDLYFSFGYKNTYVPDNDGDFKGTIVLTGQPDKKRDWGHPNTRMGQGKWKEFIFPSEIDHELKLDEDLFNKYKSLYKDSPDWAFREKDLDSKGMPVFLREDLDGLVDFGLTFMYKVPYKQTPNDLSSKYQMKQNGDLYNPDLAECIFGYTSKEDSLRGRVQFSNFVSEDAKEDASLCLVLNGPKASYYPLYIHQDNGKNGSTTSYQNYNNGELAGRKRYLLRDAIWQRKADSEKVNTVVNPLKAGSTFKGSIQFHNLRPEELGALLSALTFHGNPECHHQLGQAKPYGLGMVTLHLDGVHVPSYMNDCLEDNAFYMASFERMMSAFNPSWRYESSIQELLTIASVVVKGNNPNYQYMVMGMEKGLNEFDNAKKEKLYLQDFSKRVGKTVLLKSQYELYKEEFEKVLAEKETRKAEIERQEMERLKEAKRIEEEERIRMKIKEEEDKKAAKLAAGLGLLDEMRADGKGYKITSFKQAKNKILAWQKVSNVSDVPLEQQSQLYTTLQRLHATPDKKEKKEWGNFESKLWQDLVLYVSEETAKSWFNELNK